MTNKEKANEEKAKEIAKEYSRTYGFGFNSDSSIECYQSALQAMKWKDEQHKQEKQKWIKEACEQVENYFAPDGSMIPENKDFFKI